MTYRRRQRWLRRLALGFAFATALFAGKASMAQAVVDEGGSQSTQVIPYLSHGILTQEQADAAQTAPSGDQIAFRNATASQTATSGDELAFRNAIASRQPADVFTPGVTDFPKPTATVTPTRPDDQADRFTGVVQEPPVISYLSHGMGADGEVGARPDNRADRFSHSDVAPQPEVSSGGWDVEWNEALSFGIGGLVLVLALGLALGHLRRPRIAV